MKDIPTLPVNLGLTGTDSIWVLPEGRRTCGWPGCEQLSVVELEYRDIKGDGSTRSGQCAKHWGWFRGIIEVSDVGTTLVWVPS
jgi:hypothetical protein